MFHQVQEYRQNQCLIILSIIKLIERKKKIIFLHRSELISFIPKRLGDENATD